MKYKHRLINTRTGGIAEDVHTFPELPWEISLMGEKSVGICEVEYNETILRHPEGTLLQKINDDVFAFFITIQRKQKLEAL